MDETLCTKMPAFMPERPRVGYAYVPFQKYPGELFSPQEALKKGTVFPCLYLPLGVYESLKGVKA